MPPNFRSVFADRPLAQQFAIQAAGERLGAAAWRAFAEQAKGDHARRMRRKTVWVAVLAPALAFLALVGTMPPATGNAAQQPAPTKLIPELSF